MGGVGGSEIGRAAKAAPGPKPLNKPLNPKPLNTKTLNPKPQTPKLPARRQESWQHLEAAAAELTELAKFNLGDALFNGLGYRLGV